MALAPTDRRTPQIYHTTSTEISGLRTPRSTPSSTLFEFQMCARRTTVEILATTYTLSISKACPLDHRLLLRSTIWHHRCSGDEPRHSFSPRTISYPTYQVNHWATPPKNAKSPTFRYNPSFESDAHIATTHHADHAYCHPFAAPG